MAILKKSMIMDLLFIVLYLLIKPWTFSTPRPDTFFPELLAQLSQVETFLDTLETGGESGLGLASEIAVREEALDSIREQTALLDQYSDGLNSALGPEGFTGATLTATDQLYEFAIALREFGQATGNPEDILKNIDAKVAGALYQRPEVLGRGSQETSLDVNFDDVASVADAQATADAFIERTREGLVESGKAAGHAMVDGVIERQDELAREAEAAAQAEAVAETARANAALEAPGANSNAELALAAIEGNRNATLGQQQQIIESLFDDKNLASLRQAVSTGINEGTKFPVPAQAPLGDFQPLNPGTKRGEGIASAPGLSIGGLTITLNGVGDTEGPELAKKIVAEIQRGIRRGVFGKF